MAKHNNIEQSNYVPKTLLSNIQKPHDNYRYNEKLSINSIKQNNSIKSANYIYEQFYNNLTDTKNNNLLLKSQIADPNSYANKLKKSIIPNIITSQNTIVSNNNINDTIKYTSDDIIPIKVINQLDIQSIKQSTNQIAIQTLNQSTYLSTNQQIIQSTKQTSDQQINQSIIQIVSKTVIVEQVYNCINCKLNHKFSPFNVSITYKEILPKTLPIMILNKKLGYYYVSIIRDSDIKTFIPITKEMISLNIYPDNYGFFWSSELNMFNQDGLMKILLLNHNLINNITIDTLTKLIYCTDWWDQFLILIASNPISNNLILESLANSIERANNYRELATNSAILNDKLLKDFNYPKFTRILRNLRERQKRINEEKQQKETVLMHLKIEEDKLKRIQKFDIEHKIREQQEIEISEININDTIVDFKDKFLEKLRLNRKGNNYKFIAAINPESNIIANIIQKAGEVSKLQHGIDYKDKIHKVNIWEYYINQEADLLKGIKYKKAEWKKPDISNKKVLDITVPDLPTLPTDINKPKTLLILNNIQKTQYKKIWTDYHAEKSTNNSDFILDNWQSIGIDHIQTGRSCIFSGPTSGGKTYVMMKGLDNIINGDNNKNVVYISPTFHLAYQTYANIKATFPKRLVAIITAELINIPINANIFIGTASQLLNYFVITEKHINIGIFDEIHVASKLYLDINSKTDIIRAKAYSRLLTLCEGQVIAASATIGNESIMCEYIAIQMNKNKYIKHKITGSDIHLVKYVTRTIPLLEYRFINNNTIKPLIRDQSGIEIINSNIDSKQTKEIIDDITPRNLFILLTEMHKLNMTPTIIFDNDDDIAWKTYISLINYIELKESIDYAAYHELITKINQIIDHFNKEHETRTNAMPKEDNLDSSRLRDGQKGNGKREAGLRVIRAMRIKTYDNIISDGKTIIARSILQFNNTNIISECEIKYSSIPKYILSKIINICNTTNDELIILYPTFRINKAHIDMLEIIKRFEDGEASQVDPICNINIDKGSFYRFTEYSCGMEQLKAIREPGNDEDNWKLRKMMITLAESQYINPKDIDGIIDVIMRGLEFGITIINPSLPFVIQNIILENLRTKNMGIVIASESMSMGINYPLRSVVIKSSYLPWQYVQMGGRCGRRGKDNQAHVIYWNCINADKAHHSHIAPLTDINDFIINNSIIADESKFDNETSGSIVVNHVDLAVKLGIIYNTLYFVEDTNTKKVTVPLLSTKNGGRVKVARHNFKAGNKTWSNNKSSNLPIEDHEVERERKLCSSRQGNFQLSRSQYIEPIMDLLAGYIGFDKESIIEIVQMVSKIDANIIIESYLIDSFKKSRNINLIMHILIELHNSYALSNNIEFLTFIEHLIRILQVCEYRLIKLAK